MLKRVAMGLLLSARLMLRHADHADEFAPPTGAHHQHAAVLPDVEEHQRARQAQYHALLAI